MNLRSQLSLFFGGLIVVILSAVVYFNYQRLYDSLEQGIRQQFSLEPFVQLAEVERTLLLERATAVVDRQSVYKGVLKSASILEKEGLEKLRESWTNEESPAYVILNSAREQMLTVLTRTDSSEGQDLAILLGSEGTVFLESFNQVLRDELKPEQRKLSADRMADNSVWPVFAFFEDSRGFFVHEDSKPYIYGMASFSNRFETIGMALVGKRIDRDFLHQLAQDAGEGESATHAIVTFPGGVVGSSDLAKALGEELVKKRSEEEMWSSASGQSFLLKSTPLNSYYLPEEARDFFASEGIELPPATEVGRFYLLRDVAGIREAANSGARDTLVLGALVLILGLLTVPLLAKRFTGPVAELSDAMHGVGEGRLDKLEESKISSITEIKAAALSFNQMVVGLQQKKILEHFVPEGTRKEIEQLQGRTTELGGTRWERTIMFSDLRGFTSMSEKMTPDEVMAVLNKYLHVMSKAIRLNGGDINEYIGDAILAVFESPDDAVKASIAMTEELVELRKDRSIEALADLAQGIGLHTGPLVEGNIGEKNKRLKRAVVGDTVNLAARIQDRSREGSHSCIFISQDTKDRLKEPVDLVHFGDESFKGKAEPVPVWEVKLPEES